MASAEDLKKITRAVLGRDANPKLLSKIHYLLDEGDYSISSLVLAAKNIEKIVRFFVDEARAETLRAEFRQYFKRDSVIF